MSQPYCVLFLCKHNASRSLMAEAILNKIGNGRFIAYSAGLQPSANAHPYTLQVLTEEGFDTRNLSPKSLDKFIKEEIARIDLVIGLCNSLQEDKKIDGKFPLAAHWHINDTDSVAADSTQNKEVFSQIFRQLSQRIHLLINLPDEKLDDEAQSEAG